MSAGFMDSRQPGGESEKIKWYETEIFHNCQRWWCEHELPRRRGGGRSSSNLYFLVGLNGNEKVVPAGGAVRSEGAARIVDLNLNMRWIRRWEVMDEQRWEQRPLRSPGGAVGLRTLLGLMKRRKRPSSCDGGGENESGEVIGSP